jgi:hypothetical protein
MFLKPLGQLVSRYATGGQVEHETLLVVDGCDDLGAVQHQECLHRSMGNAFVAVEEWMIDASEKPNAAALARCAGPSRRNWLAVERGPTPTRRDLECPTHHLNFRRWPGEVRRLLRASGSALGQAFVQILALGDNTARDLLKPCVRCGQQICEGSAGQVLWGQTKAGGFGAQLVGLGRW